MMDDPENIMISVRPNEESTRRLKMINIYNGRVINREMSDTRKASFVVNSKGEPVAQVGVLKSWEDEILYKNKAGEWVEFENAQHYELISDHDDTSILMRHFASNNVTELVKFDRFTANFTVIATLTNREATSLYWDWDNKVQGYRTDIGKPDMHFFDPTSSYATFHQVLQNTFRGKFARELQRSRDGKKRLIKVSADNEPGAYYLYDEEKKNIVFLASHRTSVDRKKLAPMQPISFTARDGLEIHGYITKPLFGVSPAPMVVMVHGGPFGARDYWGYDAESQVLASHGYTVLQINFRGSGGYGIGFQRAGFKQWGKSMQDDITDGTRWAIKQGIADANRVCIYGASYGGYAALMGTVKEPELYRCAIGYAGVYDLPLKYKKGDIQEKAEGLSYIEQTVGMDIDDLKQHSPAYNVDNIKAALLLVHGEHDERVPIEHYESLSTALDKIDYPYESLIKKGEVHGFNNNKNKIELYQKMLKFLDKHIGSQMQATAAP